MSWISQFVYRSVDLLDTLEKEGEEWEILNFRKEIVSLMKLYFIICLWEKKRMKEGRDFCLDHSNFRRSKNNKRNFLDDRTFLREFCLVFGIIAVCWYEVSTEDFNHFCFPRFLWLTDTVPDLMRSENLIERIFQHFIMEVPWILGCFSALFYLPVIKLNTLKLESFLVKSRH